MSKRYKEAKIYHGKTGDVNEKWHVYYSFLDPSTGKFERLKVYEGINEFKDLDKKDKFASDLVKEINKRLDNGFSPYEVEDIKEQIAHEIKAERHLAENPKSPLLTKAFADFIEAKKGKDLADTSIQAYQGYISRFEDYLSAHKLMDIRLDQLDTKFIKDTLEWLKPIQKWNGTTYNNHLNFWALLLNWFARKPRLWIKRDNFDIGTDGELELKTTKVMKNQYFGDTVAQKVKVAMGSYPQLLFFSKFIYFSCMRPDEIRNLKIENVDITGRYIKIVGKTKSRTIPVCDELADLLTGLKLSKYPSNYYVIGRSGEVSDVMQGENYFSEMFREKIRKPLGLSSNFTLYGWKHTRVVDLLNAGYSDAEVMNLTGHRDTESYDKYKRELIGHINSTRLRGKTIGWNK